jgi:3-hydroxyisobutyrate dehydrogenase
MRSRSGEARHFSGSSSAVIGFIGLGNMGLPMCLNLASQSQVVAFDTNSAALATATQKAGIHPATSIDDIGAAHCSIIFTMLPGCQAVNAVTARLLEQVGDSVLFVDCSTVRYTHVWVHFGCGC